MFFVLLIVLIFILLLTHFTPNHETETYENKEVCKKWEGKLYNSPKNICKDCGYPIDCHGPFKGESWRHPFLFN
jgi:hypothetical protein